MASRTDMNVIISNLLKYGVILSTVLVALGLVLAFASTTTSFPDTLQQLVSTNYGRPPPTYGGFFAGLLAADPASVLQLGLLILLATPIARVVASIVLFASERDRRYVAITLFVLTVLLISTFVIGPAEAAAG